MLTEFNRVQSRGLLTNHRKVTYSPGVHRLCIARRSPCREVNGDPIFIRKEALESGSCASPSI